MPAMFPDGSMPIPGENYTSDTKNYPWHQPPEYKNPQDALDKMSVKLTDPKVSHGLVSLAEAGIPLLRIAQMICMEGIAQGKWTVDTALLLAGPFCKIVEMMCDLFDVDYDLGIEEDNSFNTGVFYKGTADMIKSVNSASPIQPNKPVPNTPPEGAEPQAEEQTETSESQDSGSSDLMSQGFAQMQSSTGNNKDTKE